MYATHAALPLMRAQGAGHIVNVFSGAGRTARVGASVYNAGKWGVGAFSEPLRQEVYKDKIRVTIIEPGAGATDRFPQNWGVGSDLQSGGATFCTGFAYHYA